MVFNKILPLPQNLLAKNRSALLIGEDGTCKTSFLFRYCHTVAEETVSRTVIYISPVRLFEMPLSFEGMHPFSAYTAQQITIFYPNTLEDLIEYLAKFFTLNVIPRAFIVDDLDYIIKRKRNQTDQTYSSVLARVFALLADNVEHCRSVGDDNCELLVATSFESNMPEESVVIKAIGEQFFDEVFTLNEYALLESTGKSFQIVPSDKSYKIIFNVQDDLIKLKQVLRKKEKQKTDDQV